MKEIWRYTVDNWRRFLGLHCALWLPDCLVALTDGDACAREDYTKHFAMLNLLHSMPSTWQDKTTILTLM